MSGQSPTRFYITTLGCKLNFAESSALIKDFTEAGFQQTRQAAEADWIIVHSCAVTAVAEKKTRQTLSKLMKAAPESAIAVTGCMADVNNNSLEELLGSRKHIIVNHSRKMNLAGLLSGNVVSNNTMSSFFGAYSLEQRTRSFLKIQDGCDYFCTYCTVPYARGRSVSNTISGVLSDIEEIASKGFREIILTGVNIGTFGLNNNESFFSLLKAIDQQCTGIRIRLGSTEPELMSVDIIDLVASSKVLMPHFHLPLQSGRAARGARPSRRNASSGSALSSHGPPFCSQATGESRRRQMFSMNGSPASASPQSCRDLDTGSPTVKPRNVTSNASRVGEQHITPTLTRSLFGKHASRADVQRPVS